MDLQVVKRKLFLEKHACAKCDGLPRLFQQPGGDPVVLAFRESRPGRASSKSSSRVTASNRRGV
ncbi:hypothetical protein AM571_CH02555 [Rhizobium etli 8C-3]|uniref:Uncharacterized protein n=1 Tax=Rhizobium etli 8C-3 TaxID=538025 RepID=A0A1L5P5E4_RHIET|nr:hypothetical protein AM571_CH02555 [Rhizobium etli 8C-3]